MAKKITLKRLLTRLLALVLIALTLSLGFAPLTTHSVATSSKYRQAEEKLKGIKDQLATIKSDREKLANRQKTLSGELAYLENRSEEQRKVYDEALEQKEYALEAMLMYQQGYANALSDYEEKTVQYEQRIARMYEWNQKSVFEMLITAVNLDSFFTTLRLMRIIADADEQALAELEAASALAEEMKQDAEASYEEMVRLVDEADAVLQKIKNEKALAAKQLSKLSNSLELTKQKQEQLERDKTSAERNLKAIGIEEAAKRASGATGSHYVGTGAYIWPTPGFYQVSSHFGWRAKYGRFHYGTDVMCPTGTRIVAMADGIVTYVGWPGSTYHWAYGKMVVINHYDGTQTRYGHLSGYNCHTGQKVNAGQVIGYTGNTGRSSGPHLHFEIRINGTPVNPMKYFKWVR
jgi:murein DD-endopeptidase MepM/ murein hydrolase activator NlpD